ncbi:MAG TPA: acyl-CoA synthetase [Thermomonospora sp.]|nr:acyl-CoA synthetase [Thermomonospora sp.]
MLVPEDLAPVEAVPLHERDLPASTYELLRRTATAYPDRAALHLLGEGGVPWRQAARWSYGVLLGRVHQAANLFLSSGLPSGGVVGLLLPNTGWTYAALLGAQAVGIANPVNPLLAEEHIADILALTGAQVVIAPGPELAPDLWAKATRVAERLPEVRTLLTLGDFADSASRQPADRLLNDHRPGPEDLAAHFHTGGTTGVPKVVPHTHANEVYMAWALGCTGAYLDGSVSLSGLPLFHVNALHVTGLGPFMHGGEVVSLGPLGYRDKRLMGEFWHIIEHFKVTSFSGVPTVYSGLPPVPEGVDISTLRAGAVGAAPLPKKVRTTFEESTRIPMLEGYGLTEATCATAATPAFAPRAGSVGMRLPYQQVKAVRVDADERPVGDCPPGEVGVLAIRGPNVFPGYLRPGPGGRPVPDPDGKIFDGWLLTGDLGRVDTDGYVYLTGRAKDLIIRGGHNIDPAPVEERLLTHPAITAAAVIGAPDPHSGEIPVAYVTVADGSRTTEDDLRAWAAAHAPEPAAAPKAVHILPALPTTAVGKIHKPTLLQDAVHRTVQAELDRLGLTGTIETTLRDGRPHAHLHLDGATDPAAAELTAELDRYPFGHTIR